ncbi:TetR/AcrR family transcriptional regulator [Amycolatopsis sp. FDAARGOS 1241]|uniref:TetR/AcrR family transcriptional regulator n=1 Tax=Amycolatopsis sp. FDAARGOS 1241 TaxID=2778070 RepID=UPI001950B1C9|nr:TetR/AcrR family transcriptional regulator [Amycolatopsis sp. FDAARGOS 1241]QRP46339.1 TetR family transcriptional regulator [Amycolatopsis sp. FDAARGOS 1241]
MTAARSAVSEEAVLDTALTLFAERGYHGTALSQIAEVLQIRTPSLYNHMRSKEDLLRAIVDRTTAAVLEDFERVTGEDDDWTGQLARATRVYAFRHATHRREALVVNRDTDCLGEPHRTQFQARRRRHEHAFRAIIACGADAGVFHVDSPALASFAIREMCVSIARWFRDHGAMTADSVADEYSRYALQIVGSQTGHR